MVTEKAQIQTLFPASGLLARAGEHIHQFICGLHGHDALLHFEGGRMSLLCSSCGHNSPGWDIKVSRKEVNESRPKVARMPLVGQQRVA